MTRFHSFGAEERKAPEIKAKPIVQRLFGIPFDFSVLTTAGAVYTSNYTISTNFDFLWELTQISKRNATTGVLDSLTAPAIRDVTLNIRDEFTSEDMFVSPIYLSMLGGDGRNQNILPRPYVFLGGTTITLNLTDVYGGTAFALQVALIGYKIKAVR